MTALLLERADAERAPLHADRELTLDELITGLWEDVAVRSMARCPACGGSMVPRGLSGGSPEAACLDCGTRDAFRLETRPVDHRAWHRCAALS